MTVSTARCSETNRTPARRPSITRVDQHPGAGQRRNIAGHIDQPLRTSDEILSARFLRHAGSRRIDDHRGDAAGARSEKLLHARNVNRDVVTLGVARRSASEKDAFKTAMTGPRPATAALTLNRPTPPRRDPGHQDDCPLTPITCSHHPVTGTDWPEQTIAHAE